MLGRAIWGALPCCLDESSACPVGQCTPIHASIEMQKIMRIHALDAILGSLLQHELMVSCAAVLQTPAKLGFHERMYDKSSQKAALQRLRSCLNGMRDMLDKALYSANCGVNLAKSLERWRQHALLLVENAKTLLTHVR